MRIIFLILKNIKNLLPYFSLIALYFIFINIELREQEKNKSIIKIESQLNGDKSREEDKQKLRISIPVVPYRQ
tara:strand:+ start:668 stop:886 length:219 start_codon:yes stop_codon:yes gene_type:complete